MTENEAIEAMRESTIRRVVGPTILLGSGRYFDFEDPESSSLTLEDVAYGLASAARFSGQCVERRTGRRCFYSVAQHSVLMSRMVAPALARAALWDDCGEAVCHDVTAPLKSMLTNYKAIEARCARAIRQRFQVKTGADRVALKAADVRMLATERRDLTAWAGEKWSESAMLEPYDFQIVPWDFETAANAFIHRERELAAIFTDHGAM